MDINLDYIYLEESKNSSKSKSYSNTRRDDTIRDDTRRDDTRRDNTRRDNTRKDNTRRDNKLSKNNKNIDENILKKTNSNFNRMFQSNSYIDFKSKIREILIQEYQRPADEFYRKIRSVRGDKEYGDGLKIHYEEMIKLKKDTEKSMYQIRQYLDYIENERENNKFLPYLIGFESKYKLGEIIIPDILGFTSKTRTDLKEKYTPFIIFMVKRFLNFSDSDFLYISIDTLLSSIDKMVFELIISDKISIDLCEYYNREPKMKALKNINNYYILLSDIIDGGKFNLNDLFKESDKKKSNKVRVGGGPTKKKDPLSTFTSSLIKSFGKSKKSKSLSIFNYDNKKSDNSDKRIKYILKYENNNISEQKININKYESLKDFLKKSGINIFIEKLRLDLDELDNFVPPSVNVTIPFSTHTPQNIKTIDDIIDEIQNKKNKVLHKDDKEYINDICKRIKDFSQKGLSHEDLLQGKLNGRFGRIIELCESISISVIDFYTGKVYETNKMIKPDEEDLKYYYGVKKLYNAYDEYYKKYGIKNLPLSSDSKIEQRRVGINILKGIGNYSSIIRNFLNDSIKRVYMDDIMVRERNRIEKLKKEKEDRDQRDQRDQRKQRNQQQDQQDQQDQQYQQEPTINNKKNKSKSKNKSKKLKKQIEVINKEIEKTTNDKIRNKLEKLRNNIKKRSE